MQPSCTVCRASLKLPMNTRFDLTARSRHLFAKSAATLAALFVALISLGVQADPSTFGEGVGTLRGTASVSSNGAATYSVPITVPEGVAGMTPTVSLDYRSDRGTGLAGAGWTVDAGAQIIHRCNATVVQDQVAKGIQHTTDDRLCLNGQRLVRISGTYGGPSSTYRTEIASFQKILASSGATQGAPNSFEVTQPDGMKYTFGYVNSTLDGRIQIGTSGPIRVWALARIEDTDGNYIDYHYFEDSVGGEYYLTSVSYTGTSDLAPRYSVTFDYEDRVGDVRNQYRAGSPLKSSKRIHQINALYQSVPIRQYFLDYAATVTGSSGHSRLEFITECETTTSTCLAPINIDWKIGDSGWEPFDDLAAENAGDRFLIGDWDGDGISDLFIADGTSPSTYTWKISRGKNGFAAADIISSTASASESSGQRYQVFDYNGDGRADIFRLTPSGNAVTGLVYESTGNPMNPFTTRTNTNISSLANVVHFRLVDYDGDGLSDFLHTLNDGSIYVKRNTGGTFSQSPTLVASPPPAPGGNSYGDIVDYKFFQFCCTLNLNNDGIPDLRVVMGVDVLHFCGPNGCFPETTLHWGLLQSTGSGYELVTNYLIADRFLEEAIDINGDGLDDLSYVTSTGSGFVQINSGNGFLTPTPSTNNVLPSQVAESHVIDYNNDGRQDRLFRFNNTGNTTVLTSNGTDFNTAIGFGSSLGSNFVFADFNGDGTSDLLVGPAGANESTSSTFEVGDSCAELGLPDGCSIEPPPPPLPTPSSATTLRLHANKTTQSDVVSTVTDGYGNYTTFTYEPIATSANYAQDRMLVIAPSVRPRWGGQHVVTAVTANDGIGGSYTVSFSYKNALFSANGRGALGFSQMTQTDSRNGLSRVTNYSQGHPRTGLVTSQVLLQSDGTTPITETETTWAERAFGTQTPARTFVYADKVVSKLFEVGGLSDGQLIKTVTSEFKYDFEQTPTTTSEFGHLIETTRKTEKEVGSANSYITTYTITPAPTDIANWCSAVVDYVKVKREQIVDAVSKDQTREIDYVLDMANCRVDEEKLFPNEAAEFRVDTKYIYDSHGNLTETIVKGADNEIFANDKPFKIRRTKTVYDTNHQFPIDVIACFDDAEAASCAKTDADNPVTSLVWNYEFGLPETIKDELNQPFTAMYDGYGRQSTLDFATSELVTTSYVDCDMNANLCWNPVLGKVRQNVTTASGSTSAIVLDSYGRVIGEEYLTVGGTKIRVDIQYDALGRLIARTNPYIVGDPRYFQKFFYDDIGRVYRTEEKISEEESGVGEDRITTIDYDKLTTTTTDAKAQETKVVYDLIGRVVESHDANHETAAMTSHLKYEYGAWDELLTTTNTTDGSQVVMFHDVRGRVTSVDDPDRGVVSYKYDPVDTLVWRDDPTGQVRKYEYDSLGRLANRTDAGVLTQYDYYKNKTMDGGNFARLKAYQVNPAGSGHKVGFNYDVFGRVYTETATVPNAAGYPTAGVFGIDYRYDVYGRLGTLTYPETDGVEQRFGVKYAYEAGQLKSVENNDDASEVFFRLDATDGWGNAKTITLGNGLVTERDFDGANGWLKTVMTGPGGGSAVQDLAFSWDLVGNLSSRTDHYGDTRVESYTYDKLNRLETSTLAYAMEPAVPNLSVVYDPNGNITSKSDFGTTYEYGQNNAGPHQVTTVKTGTTINGTYGYDLNGNMNMRNGHMIDWSSFDKPTVLRADNAMSSFSYDANYRRYRQIEVVGSRSSETIYVGGLFERHVSNLATGGADVIGYRHAIMVGNERIATQNLVKAIGDSDSDAIPDAIDNCVLVTNSDQRDTNGDGYGNICDPDLNGDLIVNVQDLGLFKVAIWGALDEDPNTPGNQSSANWDPDVDFNGDGTVNIIDLGILKTFFLITGPGPAGDAVIGWTTRYFQKDHLATITKITDHTGAVAGSFSYDAFGQSRDADTWGADSEAAPDGAYWTITSRGYTDHEQLRGVGLTHMNGRVYDPVLGRVLSSDPFIPDPLNTQSFNRLSYVRNNPLSLVDPSGFHEHETPGDINDTEPPPAPHWVFSSPGNPGFNFRIQFTEFGDADQLIISNLDRIPFAGTPRSSQETVQSAPNLGATIGADSVGASTANSIAPNDLWAIDYDNLLAANAPGGGLGESDRADSVGASTAVVACSALGVGLRCEFDSDGRLVGIATQLSAPGQTRRRRVGAATIVVHPDTMVAVGLVDDGVAIVFSNRITIELPFFFDPTLSRLELSDEGELTDSDVTVVLVPDKFVMERLRKAVGNQRHVVMSIQVFFELYNKPRQEEGQ